MIYRKLFDKLKKHVVKKEFCILTGARQTGKSTLLRQLESYCKDKEIPTLFLNFENKVFLNEMNENPLNLLHYLPDTNKRVVVFIDEVQYVNDPSNFMKLLYDEHAEEIKIIASGSSAFYIDKRFRDSLAGRKRLFHLPTCNFDEYLELSGKLDLQKEKHRLTRNPSLKSTQITFLQKEWESYMIYGGYPAIITEPDPKEKIEKLKEIRDSFVKRDILESGVNNETAFYNLFSILASQTGNLVNTNELASTLRIKNDTVNNYLKIMQKCFHIVLTKPFHRNLRKELVKMPKVFLLDTGLRNCLLNNFMPMAFRADKGELWENSVFRLLADKYGTDEVKYWHTSAGNEVDFVLPDIDTPIAIEAKYSKTQIKISKYKIFTKAYPEIPLSFVWMQPFDEAFFQTSAH